jgi:hypothetical protein
VPVPPVQALKPLPDQLKVQPLKSGPICELAGLSPAEAQLASLTVIPSERRHETLRVSVAVAEQLLFSAPKLPALQLKEHVLKSLKVSLNAASVPHEKLVGVQAFEAAGCVPALLQLVLATVVPSERRQETVCVSAPELTFTSQLAVRVCVKLAPQPVLGAQEV